MLVDFILTCIWRMAASRTRGRPGHALGHYADLIEGRLFGPGEGCDPAVFIESFEIDDGEGAPLVIAVLPSPANADRGSWHFIVSGLRFVVDFTGLFGIGLERANSLAFVSIDRGALRSVDEVDGLRQSLERMSLPRRRPSSAKPGF
ncbi:hypothetical protein ACFSQT_02090 [Mesorhizobium calcicola]|uniref:Uncharacterized protein n=1 Tax=Mesorhizobium calcicola TaxID=1300310 RepID=A0ABW4W6P5_9HYPH